MVKYLKKDKNIEQQLREEGENMEGNSHEDTKLSEEGGKEMFQAPEQDVPCETVMKCDEEGLSPCSPWCIISEQSRAEIYTTVCGGLHARASTPALK